MSATAVRMTLGRRFGRLTALLDVAKVAIPVLAFRLWAPDQSYYLTAAVRRRGDLADASVVGAPQGTLLVTLMGTASRLGDLDPDALAGAIVPLPDPGS